MESGAIADGQIRASSSYDGAHTASHGRLHFQRSPGAAWSAIRPNNQQWLQIDLGSQYTRVTRVATQGRSDTSQWVTTYKLLFSDDGAVFLYHKERGQTDSKVRRALSRRCCSVQNQPSTKAFPSRSLDFSRNFMTSLNGLFSGRYANRFPGPRVYLVLAGERTRTRLAQNDSVLKSLIKMKEYPENL